MRRLSTYISLAALALTLASCDDLIYEHSADCHEGMALTFVYDYNMEWADAFLAKVHCLKVLVYDSEGNLAESRTERTEILQTPGYTMTIDLPAGEYHVVAYGGMDCDDASFAFDNPVETLKSSERTVSLCSFERSDEDGVHSSTLLHDHFFGMVDVDVPAATTEYAKATVEMMKNTNHFKVILQQVNGMPLESKDFDVRITDDNIKFGHDNAILPTETGITYHPWSEGENSVGTNDNNEDWTVAYTELSTSRLIERKTSRSAATPSGTSGVDSPRLIITHNDSGSTVLDIPLLKYLLLFKSDRYARLSDQEFLDRMSEWNVIFFLDNNLSWINTHIVVNDWVVRINDTEL